MGSRALWHPRQKGMHFSTNRFWLFSMGGRSQPTAHNELRMLRGLLPFAQSVLRLRTWSTILAYDACLVGYGVVSCNSSVTDAQEICQCDERWRFREEDFARRHLRECALAEFAEFVAFERVSSDICADVSISVENVSSPLLSQERWNNLYAGRFHHDERVHLLEASGK